ncbi:MAG: signal peptidase II [Oscillospiraceae bacterium]|nr:signal peptidase II [Oscillospiraceae bacterium]
MLETLVIILLVALDQIVKYFVRTGIPMGGHVDFLPGILGLTHFHNTGAAFSFLAGSGARWFFVVLTVVFVIAAMWVLLKKKLTHPLGRWTLVLIVAGAIGNLIDRALFGYVVDMIETQFMNFPIFNVADIYVTVGGIAFCIYFGFIHDKVKAAEAAKAPENSPENGEAPEEEGK